ncbi:YceD family protein [Lactobacillus mulieris]|jgi:metal-binding protein|uniref:DUF177 domain-containing protein n=1 Tax=Lactobacillus mulieris TaxID=2508708 RepID=A0AAP3GWX2_9LACO|nr:MULTISPECIES: YceD family protein [Lactobacillus]EEU21092.1 hypothetical protein HMPREF0525_00026 [Lactobacillus jensenii 27-2-CHN]EEX23966.1 putative ACR, COG1399 [Lactobacillus jensenii 115-3-CHN]EFH29140.1 putative ACR, COG1399 [Lactobacillus jensenii JV-V16]KAA9244409.1 DUF177 domain-containing protein [Lactobacillus jensenii]KAA9369432.1 DUF177 domain-containing protein [Lactobacillus jensenii]
MLTINFSQIKKSKEPLTEITTKLETRPEFFARAKELLLDAKNIQVKGQMFYQEPFVTGNFQVEADVVAPSSRSLAPVPMHLNFSFTENYLDREPTNEEKEEVDMIVPIDKDTIDLQTAIEDNLLLSLPTTILTKDEEENNEFPQGTGWEVVSEESLEKQNEEKINPAFAKLKDLFPDSDEK